MKGKILPGGVLESTRELLVERPWGRGGDEFIRVAHMIYGDMFSYERVVYRRGNEPVEIICREHGPFSVTPSNFLQGKFCPQCEGRALVIPEWPGTRVRRWTRESFIEASREIHGDKYDYSLVGDVFGSLQQLTLICDIHGPFKQRIRDHIGTRHGCFPCGLERVNEINRKPFSHYLGWARRTHGDRYEYDESTYKGSVAKMKIICPIHGPFWQSPAMHVLGNGCSRCTKPWMWGGKHPILSHKMKRYTFDEFVARARAKFGDQYVYDRESYTHVTGDVTFTCPRHGTFTQKGVAHLSSKYGCPGCGRMWQQNKKRAEALARRRDDFREKRKRKR